MRKSFVCYVAFGFSVAVCRGLDWPQLQCTPQRTGFTAESIALPQRPADAKPEWTPLKVGWTRVFTEFDPPQHVNRVTQIIACAGKLFVPTMEGKLYALAPRTGEVLWVFDGKEGIMHTAAAEAGRVFVATIHGSVFAVDIETGRQLWQWRNNEIAGFSASPLLAEGKLFVGSRIGMFHALDQATGSELWRAATDGPIYQSAAYNEGRVYAASEDMHAYCWRASDGTVLWKSIKLNGQSFRDYYPLVYRGRVFFEAQHAWSAKHCAVPAYGGTDGWFPLAAIFDHEKEFESWLAEHGREMAEGKPSEAALNDILKAQQEQLAMFEQFPHENLRHVLDEKTGKPLGPPMPLVIQAMCGNQPPPVVDRDGLLIIPAAFYNYRYSRFDLERGQYTDMLMGLGTWEAKDGIQIGRGGNHDEVNNVSAAGPLIFNVHSLEWEGISGQGFYDLDSRQWLRLPSGVWADGGGPRTSLNPPNVQCGGNAVSVAYGMAYHHSYGIVHNWEPATPGK